MARELMQGEVVLKDHPDIAAVIRAAFPDYRRKTAMVKVAEKCSLNATFWDGGTRYSYVAVDLATKLARGAPQYDPPQFGGPQTTPVVAVPPGIVIVQAGTFCGKPSLAYIYVHLSNVQTLLPAKA